MEAFEKKPEVPHKRKSRTKKVLEKSEVPAGPDISSDAQEKLAPERSVGTEKKSTQPKGNRQRQRKSVKQQAAESEQALGTNPGTTVTLPPAPRLTVSDLLQETPAAVQKVELSATISKEVQPLATISQAVKSEVKDSDKEFFSFDTRILQNSVKGLGWLFNLCAAAVVSILLGFSQPISHIPVLDFIQHHTLTTLIILCIIGIFTLVVLLILPSVQKRSRPMDARFKTMGIVTSISTLSCVLCLSLLAVTLARPSWCPSTLCPAPKVITKPITTTQGSHDANLDVYFISFQSAAYVIPGDPQVPDYIPSSNNPRSVGAVLLDTSKISSPYTVAVGLHSLYVGPYAIFIDQVRLLVTKVNLVPNPLHVYPVVLLTTYSTTNPSRFVYLGQQANQTIPDTYSASPIPRVELRSGESDQIDAAIESPLPVDMHFRIQVIYHIASQGQRSILTLPQVFEVVFSTASNWQKYQLNLDQSNFVPISGSEQ
jgi:hypothetical protein